MKEDPCERAARKEDERLHGQALREMARNPSWLLARALAGGKRVEHVYVVSSPPSVARHKLFVKKSKRSEK